jgi:hypothetical protein
MANLIEDLEGIELLAVLAAFFGVFYIFYEYVFCPYISSTGCGNAAANNINNPANNNIASLGQGLSVGNGATACGNTSLVQGGGLGCAGNLIGNYAEGAEEDITNFFDGSSD